MSGAASVAVALSAAGSLVSATAATITVLGRRPKVVVTARRGHLLGISGLFIESDAGNVVGVAVVNLRDIPVELEVVWIQLQPTAAKRAQFWLHLKLPAARIRRPTGMVELFPKHSIPDLPETVRGRHRLVVQIGLAQVAQRATAESLTLGRAIARLSDERVVVSNWITVTGGSESSAPMHEVSPEYHEAPND